MSTFIYFAGFIILILVLKFIYDSYLTSNTEKEWEKYNNKNSKHQAVSNRSDEGNNESRGKNLIESIADELECEIDQVEEKYIEYIAKDGTLMLPVNAFNHLFQEEIKIEADKYGLNQNETRAYLLYSWAKKVFVPSERLDYHEIIFREKEKNFLEFYIKNKNIIGDFFICYPNIYDSFVYNYDNFLNQGLGLGELTMDVLGECYGSYEDEVFTKVKSKLIELGLVWSDTPSSYANFVTLAISKELSKPKDKLSLDLMLKLEEFANKAINNLDENEFEQVRLLVTLFKMRAQLKELRNDEQGSLKDRIQYYDYDKKFNNWKR